MDIARFRKTGIAALLAACAIPAAGVLRAADDSSPQPPPRVQSGWQSLSDQVVALRSELGQKRQEAYQAYVAAEGKSPEERSKIYESKLPNPVPYAQKAMDLASGNTDSPEAIDALLFVLEETRGNAREDLRLNKEAMAQLTRDDLNNPKLSQAFSGFAYNPSEEGTRLMQVAAEKSSSPEVRGSAYFWLAQSRKFSAERSGNQTDLAEAKKLFEKVATEYGDVKTWRLTLGEQAKANLYEIENLAIGKPAPQIEGKDADGKPIKLSDYTGKVVVIDFWGNW